MRTIKITREQFDQLGLLPGDYLSATTIFETAYANRIAPSRLHWDAKLKKLNVPPKHSHVEGWFVRLDRAGANLPAGVDRVGVPLKAGVAYQVGAKQKDGSFLLLPLALTDTKIEMLGHDESRRYKFYASEAKESTLTAAENTSPFMARVEDGTSQIAWERHLMSPIPDTNNMGQFAPADQTREQQREEMLQVQRAAHTSQPRGPIGEKIAQMFPKPQNAAPAQ